MNLLEMLGGSLTQDESVDNIARKSKSSKAQIIKLVGIFLPLVITYLTRNARKEGGAKSLAGALGQHRSTASMSSQIADADSEDGEKILRHIFGDDEDQITKNMARQTGMDQSQVLSALDAMLPGIMSGISASASKAGASKKSGVDLSDGIDLGDIMGMLGGSSSGKSGGFGLEALLGGALGMSQTKKPAAKKTEKKSATGNPALDGLMGQLFGGTQKEAPSKKSTMDGTELIKMLAGMM